MKRLTIIFLLMLFWQKTVAKGQPYLTITISTRQDTLYPSIDSSSMYTVYKISDSLITIRIKNIGDTAMEIPDDFNIGYKEDFWTKIFFRTWFFEAGDFRLYESHEADIDFFGDLETEEPKRVLGPGEEVIRYTNPFRIYGHRVPGKYKLQAVYPTAHRSESNYVEIVLAGKDTLSALSNDVLYEEASKAMEAGKYYDAAAYYDVLGSRFPNSATLEFERGLCAWYAGNYDNASTWLAFAISHDTNNISYRLKFADAQRSNKQFSSAGEEYKHILKMTNCPDSLKTLLPAAIEMMRRKQIDADEHDPEKLRSKANDLQRSGNYKGALALYNKAEQLDPSELKEMEYFGERGSCEYQLNMLNDALADFNKAIAKRPNNPYYYYYRSQVFVKQRKYKDACADIDRALTADKRGYLIEDKKAEVEETRKKYCNKN